MIKLKCEIAMQFLIFFIILASEYSSFIKYLLLLRGISTLSIFSRFCVARNTS